MLFCFCSEFYIVTDHSVAQIVFVILPAPHNDLAYFALCWVQTDVSCEQKVQFSFCFFDLGLTYHVL